MGAIASQITSLTIVYSIVIQTQIKENTKLRVTGLCAGNSPGTGEFPAQMASYAENVSIWWRHHDFVGYTVHNGMRTVRAFSPNLMHWRIVSNRNHHQPNNSGVGKGKYGFHYTAWVQMLTRAAEMIEIANFDIKLSDTIIHKNRLELSMVFCYWLTHSLCYYQLQNSDFCNFLLLWVGAISMSVGE